MIIFPSLLLALGLAAREHVERLELLAAAIGLGVLLGIFGLNKTQFEPSKKGLFYTPNVHLGITLSLLFVGRIIYRFVEVYNKRPWCVTWHCGRRAESVVI